MAYGNILTDVIQSSTTNTPPVFKDGNGTEVGELCRAWVNFNGLSGSVGIRASFNVSSVTRSGTGQYLVNFTNAMPDANYSFTYGTDRADCLGGANGTMSTTQVGVRTRNGVNSDTDTTNVCVAIFR